MSLYVLDKRASDNRYLHRDFHRSMDLGLTYLLEHGNVQAVEGYLRRFAGAYHAPLIERMRAEGLTAFEAYLLALYHSEEAEDAIRTEWTKEGLRVRIEYCPGVRAIRAMGAVPSELYVETTRTVYDEIARRSGHVFRLEAYDPDTGRACWTMTREVPKP